MAQWFLRKASFNFHMYMSLGQGEEMTLTLITHIRSLTLHLPIFSSQAAIVLKNPLLLLFPIEKPILQIFTLCYNHINFKVRPYQWACLKHFSLAAEKRVGNQY